MFKSKVIGSIGKDAVIRTINNREYCLPYNERTMHLLGTTEDYREEQL